MWSFTEGRVVPYATVTGPGSKLWPWTSASPGLSGRRQPAVSKWRREAEEGPEAADKRPTAFSPQPSRVPSAPGGRARRPLRMRLILSDARTCALIALEQRHLQGNSRPGPQRVLLLLLLEQPRTPWTAQTQRPSCSSYSPSAGATPVRAALGAGTVRTSREAGSSEAQWPQPKRCAQRCTSVSLRCWC